MNNMKNTILSLVSILFLITVVIANSDSEEYLITDWSYQPNDFINIVYSSDLDNDGIREVIVGSRDGIIYNLGKKGKQSGHKNWETNVGGEIKALEVVDIDDDGKEEIIVGVDRTKKGMRILDYQGLDKGSTIEFKSRVYDLCVEDIDKDGKKEIIIGSANGKVYVIKWDIKQDKLIWEYTSKGPVHYVHATDLNGDGDIEIIAMSKWTEVDETKAEICILNKKGGLEWNYEIEDGIFPSADKTVDVTDLDNDGKKEIVIGTYKHGVDVLDCNGKLKWNFPTERLVNVIYTSDLDNDGNISILVGARPYFYVVDKDGRLEWKTPVNTTIFSIYTTDLNNDNRIEILIGATRYIHILDDNGNSIGTWSYKGEIRGLTKAYKIKDADARSIYSADVDNDQENELIVGFGWEEDRLDRNYYLGDIRVFKVNKEYEIPTTTIPKGIETTTTIVTTTKRVTTTTDMETEKESKAEGHSYPSYISFLIWILGLTLLIALGILYLVVSKRKDGVKKEKVTKGKKKTKNKEGVKRGNKTKRKRKTSRK